VLGTPARPDRLREDCIAPFVGGHDDVVVAQSQVAASERTPGACDLAENADELRKLNDYLTLHPVGLGIAGRRLRRRIWS
jgi:hypothetical protein